MTRQIIYKSIDGSPAGQTAAVLGDVDTASSATIQAKLDELCAQRESTLMRLELAVSFEPNNLLTADEAEQEANDNKVVHLRRQVARIDKLEKIDRGKLAEARERDASRHESSTPIGAGLDPKRLIAQQLRWVARREPVRRRTSPAALYAEISADGCRSGPADQMT